MLIGLRGGVYEIPSVPETQDDRVAIPCSRKVFLEIDVLLWDFKPDA